MNHKHGFFTGVLFLLSLYAALALGQEKNRHSNKNVIVEYKKYQSFDLGGLQIEGEVISPGDLTIEGQANKALEYQLFNRKHFQPEMIRDIRHIR